MCEFCLKHGEGKKWYLQAANYSQDLLSDTRRRKMIQRFFTTSPESLGKQIQGLAELEKAPAFIRRAIVWRSTRKAKKVHYGQVVPIEEIGQILDFVNSIVRVACVCRQATLGLEKRYCYGVSISTNGGGFAEIMKGLDGSYLSGPETSGLEKVDKKEALASMKALEKDGLCHTVWTFQTPFIGGICNCDRADCLAMRVSVNHGIPAMFRGEYVAEITPDSCSGCRECLRVCPFGALAFSASNRKVSVDQLHCWGCGICRSSCAREAIHLLDRASVPAAAMRW